MDAYTWIINTLRLIGDKFDSTAQLIDGVPVVGEYLAAPFYFFGDKFDYIADLFATVNDLWEWLQASYEELPTWDDLLAALAGMYGSITNEATELVAWIHDAIDLDFDISGLWAGVHSTKAWIAALPDIVDHTWSEVTGYADAKIASLGDIVSHTWSEVTDYADAKIAALSDIADHTWSEVTGTVETATEGLKTWFGEQEEMVYGWISDKWVDKILDLVDAKMDYFKDKMWKLIEKFLDRM